MIAVLMTNQLQETGPFAVPNKFQMLQAEKDVKLAIDSGYEPDAFGTLGNIPITADLLRVINEQKLAAATKETEESQSVKLREEREEKREQTQQSFMDELSDEEKREEYLNSKHALGDMELTGKEWEHIAKYAKENRDRIKAEWLENGVDEKKAELAFKAVDIMARGPQNDEEQNILKQASQDKEVMGLTSDLHDQAGLEADRNKGQAPAQSYTSSTPIKQAYEPSI